MAIASLRDLNFSEGVKWEGNCAGKQEGKRSLQNLSAISILPVLYVPIAFGGINCITGESKSKESRLWLRATGFFIAVSAK
jgi:hypothetical protein